MHMLTKQYPMVQFKKDTWEIDEFDCASIFLLVGTEKAMVIDTGMGIGDLRGAISMLTDKPLICVISHGHVDHTGNARQFDDVWINPLDMDKPVPQDLDRRRFDTERIAHRQKGCYDGVYKMFRLYPYDINIDLRSAEAYPQNTVFHDLQDGQKFDLGGGRIVTAYFCPGHSAGEMIFLDEQTRSLFCGDALNFNLGIGHAPLETTLRYMKRMRDMQKDYDGIYNGHHDFRALGMPLDSDCLPNVIDIMEDAVAGHIVPCDVPNFWGGDMPLSADAGKSYTMTGPRYDNTVNMVGAKKIMLRKGRNFLMFDPSNIHE